DPTRAAAVAARLGERERPLAARHEPRARARRADVRGGTRPLRDLRRPGDDSRIGTSAPRTASTKSIVSSDSTSAPRRLRVDVVGPAPRPPPPPNRPPKRSPSPPAPPAWPPAPALRSRSFRSNGCPPDAPVPKPPG